MAHLNFIFKQDELQNIADSIIKQALHLGATSAQLELSESISTDITVLNQQIENFETSHENQFLLTVFCGNKKGSIGLSTINLPHLSAVIQQALDIAKYTEEDLANGLLEPQYQARTWPAELELYRPYVLENAQLIHQAKQIEALALAQSSQISASDGASITLTQYNFVTANSNNFNSGYQTSRYSNYFGLIGETADGMQTDYWYSSARDYHDLMPIPQLAATAAGRVLRRLTKGTFSSGKPQVIFESGIAKGIIGSLIGALSGGSLYRRLSFLNDSLGTQVLPAWINISEDPFMVRGLASCYFDNEASQVAPRYIIEHGKVNGYILSSYSARKMHLAPTGNAGGTHNILVSHNFAGDLAALAQEMANGIIIIETIGNGLNMVTGDYSVGASGLVVSAGVISHFVDNLTISGNMREIFNNIALIANDSEPNSVICGSMLINAGTIQVSSK